MEEKAPEDLQNAFVEEPEGGHNHFMMLVCYSLGNQRLQFFVRKYVLNPKAEVAEGG